MVLTNDALLPLLELSEGFNVPPLLDVAQVVELPALVVEAVRDLVPNDDTDTAVVQGLGEVFVVERWLQDGGREH